MLTFTQGDTVWCAKAVILGQGRELRYCHS